MPLIRFDLHDAGGVLEYDDVISILKESALNPYDRLRQAGWNKQPWKLPFVYLHGRSDQTLIFYAANIYPEQVKYALNEPIAFKNLTGKFQMEKKYTISMDEELIIHIEL